MEREILTMNYIYLYILKKIHLIITYDKFYNLTYSLIIKCMIIKKSAHKQ